MATSHAYSGSILNCIRANITRNGIPHNFKHATKRHYASTVPLPKIRINNPSSLKPHKTPKKKQQCNKQQQYDGINKGHRTSLFANPVAWYSKKLESHPLTTKCLSSGFIAGSGDLTCQYIVARQRRRHRTTAAATTDGDRRADDPIDDEDRFEPDLARTGRFVLLGGALIGPTVHHWYGALMRYIPGTSFKAVLKRTFFDQAIFAPLFQPTFLASLLLLERSGGVVGRGSKGSGVEEKEKEDISSVLIRTVPDLIVSNWMLWIPAMIINFKYVPGKWQVLYSNGIGFVWNVYLSWKTQEEE